jgi:hypothetical protein
MATATSGSDEANQMKRTGPGHAFAGIVNGNLASSRFKVHDVWNAV